MQETTTKLLLTISVVVFFSTSSLAQDVHYLQFDATPQAVNPAFTGMFDGRMRVSYLYRNQWVSTVPCVTHVGSIDMPVYTDKNGNYIAAGVQYARDIAGDGGLVNSSSTASVACHKYFGKKNDEKSRYACDLGIGIQGGYIYQTINVTSSFYNNDYPQYNVFIPPHGGFMRIPANYYRWNAGLCFSQSINTAFHYTIAIAVNNINQPSDQRKKQDYLWFGTNRNITGTARANWQLNRLSVKPSVYFMTREKLTAFIAGSEFCYNLSKPAQRKNPISVFIGGWYRQGDIASLTAGVEFNSFRIGIGYEDYFPPIEGTYYSGGLELSVKYVMPTRISGITKRNVPYGRF